MVNKYEISLPGFHTTQVRNTKVRGRGTPLLWGKSATGPKRSGKYVGRKYGGEKAGFNQGWSQNGRDRKET
jgi:hypothetical protein